MKLIVTKLIFLLAIVCQGQTALNYGQAVFGELLSTDQIDTYQFDATAGDRIYIRMRDAETPVDACFEFVAPNGQVLENPCGDGGIVYIKDHLIQETGTYTLRAHDANFNDVGRYGLSLYLLNAPDYAEVIDCGHDGEKEITVSTEINSYRFSAEAGDKVLLRMRSANSSFESEVEIYDAAGNLLIGDYGSGLTSLEGFEIPETGDYTILANDRNGNDLGLYGLSIQMTNRQDCSRILTCGDNTTGEIKTLAGIDAFTFSIGTNVPVIAQGRSANGSFETQLIIYDSAGNLVAQSTGSSKLQNITESLAAGEYLALVIDKGGNDKAEYGIALQYLGTENCAEGIYCYFNSSTENLSTLAAMKSYSFSCPAGSIVTAEALGISEHFDPEILIYDQSGNMLGDGYSFSVTSLQDIEMPEDGEYCFILKDWNGNDTGDFKFSITSEAFLNIPPELDNTDLPAITADCGVILDRPTATDQCEGTIVGRTTDPIEYTEIGTYEVTWVFENSHGTTATQTQKVIIQDTEAPIINCSEQLTFALSENGAFFLTEDHLNGLVNDDCSGLAWIEIETMYFDCDMIGINEVTLWTMDNAGNESSCSIKVKIEESDYCAPICGELATPWKIRDIGEEDHEQEGSVCYDPTNPTFEVTSYGKDIFGEKDEFTFVYKELCGSGVIQAKVSNLSSDAKYALAGIMMRKNNQPGSKYAALLVSPEQGVYYQARLKKDEYTLFEAHEGHAPVWIKLVRKNKLISGYISKDAIDWELACEIKVNLGDCYSVGIAASAYDTSIGNTGTVEYVQIDNIEGNTNFAVRPPSTIEMADPCQFEIDDRGQTADCAQRATESEPAIHVYPNPTAEWVTINGTEFNGSSVTVTIIDRIGKVHFTGSYDNAPANLPIDLKKLKMPNGIYTVVINDGKKVATENFLVIDED